MKDRTLAVFCPSPGVCHVALSGHTAMFLMQHLELLHAEASSPSQDQPCTWGSPDEGTAGNSRQERLWKWLGNLTNVEGKSGVKKPLFFCVTFKH